MKHGKLAVIARNISSRIDLVRYINHLDDNFKVVLFTNKKPLYISSNIEVRLIPKTKSIVASIARVLYLTIGQLPFYKKNYFVLKLFELSATATRFIWIKGFFIKFRLYLPSLISYDFYINFIGRFGKFDLNGIDRALVITESGSHILIGAMLRSKIPVDAYVYSWDHPFKHMSFSKKVRNWYVWSDDVKNDLVKLHNIDFKKIKILGSTQLSLVDKYISEYGCDSKNTNSKYIYYGCGLGYGDLVFQEIELIKYLSKVLRQLDRGYKLIVRTYPLVEKDKNMYHELKGVNNIIIDEPVKYSGNPGDKSFLIHSGIKKKYDLIRNAEAVFHSGTTLGLEACYFDIPVFFIAADDFTDGKSKVRGLSLFDFMHQQHNIKYLKLTEYENVITKVSQLSSIIRKITQENKSSLYLNYNYKIRSLIPIVTEEKILNDLFLDD
jgi:hypothetical protein